MPIYTIECAEDIEFFVRGKSFLELPPISFEIALIWVEGSICPLFERFCAY
jgi:hypothetical protein